MAQCNVHRLIDCVTVQAGCSVPWRRCRTNLARSHRTIRRESIDEKRTCRQGDPKTIERLGEGIIIMKRRCTPSSPSLTQSSVGGGGLVTSSPLAVLDAGTWRVMLCPAGG